MLPIYLGAMVFGGMLVAVSLIFGGDDDLDVDADADVDLDLDADVDVDVDVDADADVDHDLVHGLDGVQEAMWLPFLSLRFWTFALASFGLTGTLLHLLVGLAAIVLPVALLTGLVVGTTSAWVFRRLKRDTVTAEVGLKQYIGAEARVLLPIRPGSLGKICIETLAGRVELLARTGDDRPIERGERVLVAHIDEGTADVTSLSGGRPTRSRQGVTS